MITEAFFIVTRFDLEGYNKFIGSRCVVRVSEQTTEANSFNRCGIKDPLFVSLSGPQELPIGMATSSNG